MEGHDPPDRFWPRPAINWGNYARLTTFMSGVSYVEIDNLGAAAQAAAAKQTSGEQLRV